MSGVRVFAIDADIDLAHPIPLSFGHVVDEIELARLFKKAGDGADVCKHEATTAIDVSDQPEIGIHL